MSSVITQETVYNTESKSQFITVPYDLIKKIYEDPLYDESFLEYVLHILMKRYSVGKGDLVLLDKVEHVLYGGLLTFNGSTLVRAKN